MNKIYDLLPHTIFCISFWISFMLCHCFFNYNDPFVHYSWWMISIYFFISLTIYFVVIEIKKTINKNWD